MAGAPASTGEPSTTTGGSASSRLTPAEEACLRAVISETGNANPGVGNSRPIQGGTEVIVAVGEQQAAWQCIAYADGSTSRPMSLTNEGAL